MKKMSTLKVTQGGGVIKKKKKTKQIRGEKVWEYKHKGGSPWSSLPDTRQGSRIHMLNQRQTKIRAVTGGRM